MHEALMLRLLHIINYVCVESHDMRIIDVFFKRNPMSFVLRETR